MSDAAVQARAARANALINVDDPAATAALDTYFVVASPARAEVDGWLNALRETAQRVRAHPTTPDSLTVEQVTFGEGSPPTSAGLVVCVVDSRVVYQPATPDTSEVVKEEYVAVSRAVYQMTNDGTGWKLFGTTTIQQFDSVDTCPPSDPMEIEEAAVSAAARQARLASINAYIQLDDPAAIAALDQYYVAGSEARATVDRSMQDLRDEGWRVRPHASILDAVTVEQVTFNDGPRSADAELIVCVVSPATIYEPGGAPDGGDVIVNDSVATYRLIYRMTRVDGVWKLYSVEEIDRWEGVTECPGDS